MCLGQQYQQVCVVCISSDALARPVCLTAVLLSVCVQRVMSYRQHASPRSFKLQATLLATRTARCSVVYLCQFACWVQA